MLPACSKAPPCSRLNGGLTDGSRSSDLGDLAMTLAPLYAKYRTKSGNCYLYDAATNEIIRVGEVIYEILDDFRVLDMEEIVEKHRPVFDETLVRNSLDQLAGLQASGILRDHLPQVSRKATYLRCQGIRESLADLLENRRRLLILELTQRCNLRCDYCCFGEHYPDFRGHGEDTMSLETAKNAVRDFVEHNPQRISIGFYGGEPLLEFTLLTQIVHFAEELARQRGMTPRFSITTNGTLLRDDVLRFLVEHDFDVAISCDGPKESHDRHRVFRNEHSPGQRRGSYDVVIANLERFCALYPEYASRSLALTLTATSDFHQINAFLKRWSARLHAISVKYVLDVPGGRQANHRAIRVGVYGSSCSPAAAGLPVDGVASEAKELPEFCRWTAERNEKIQSLNDHFLEELSACTDSDAIEGEYPLYFHTFRNGTVKFHNRAISRCPANSYCAYKCFPGAARTFCATNGEIYPCEKTGRGRFFRLGDAAGGVDKDVAYRMTEVARLISDCGNCVAWQWCPLCFASLPEDKESGRADALAFQDACSERMWSLSSALIRYTTVMELNQDTVDSVLHEGDTRDWLDDVVFLPTEEELCAVALDVEELAEGVDAFGKCASGRDWKSYPSSHAQEREELLSP